jgi:thiosulfate/3-mercaptopyruvate sulfurtransferase
MKNTIVSANWLKENLHSKDLVIIDASPEGNVSGLASEYDGVQITGARPVSLKKDLSKKDSLFPNTLLEPADLQKTARRLGINKTSVVVVYDNLGIYTAPRVWWLFITMGLTECYVLDGGLPEWVKAKGETESRKLYSGKKGNFEANFNTKGWRGLKSIENNIKLKEEQVVDARSQGRFKGTAPEPRAGLSSGSISGSKNLPFKEVLKNGKLKTKNELKTIFTQMNLKNSPIVFSCGSGLTACITLLAASQVLQNTFSVYDGSWTEWAQLRPELIKKQKK